MIRKASNRRKQHAQESRDEGVDADVRDKAAHDFLENRTHEKIASVPSAPCETRWRRPSVGDRKNPTLPLSHILCGKRLTTSDETVFDDKKEECASLAPREMLERSKASYEHRCRRKKMRRAWKRCVTSLLATRPYSTERRSLRFHSIT